MIAPSGVWECFEGFFNLRGFFWFRAVVNLPVAQLVLPILSHVPIARVGLSLLSDVVLYNKVLFISNRESNRSDNYHAFETK